MSSWLSFERFQTSWAWTPLVKGQGLCSVDCDERKTTPSEAVLLKQSRPKALWLIGSADCLLASPNIITMVKT
jgi:hypothetical protein